MKQENTFVQVALGFVNIILSLFGIALVLSMILYVFHIAKVDLFPNSTLSITTGKETGWVGPVLSFLGSGIIWYVLFCVRQFFKNILAEQIFVAQNVTLAKRIANLLFLAAFLGNGILEFNGYSFFNVTFIVTALVVWTLGKVLEKANAIADENEFTI